jgi:hypothetical protein
MKTLDKDYTKTEDDMKALQSVGQIIGEVLKQLDHERCKSRRQPEVGSGSERVRRTWREVGSGRVGGSRWMSGRRRSSQRGRCGTTRCARSIFGGRE